MPPRIPVLQCLRAPNAPTASSRAFTSSASSHASTATQKRRHQDPYAIAQGKARKAANLSRQEVLRKERTAALGDPVKGVETPFLRSLDTAINREGTDGPISTSIRKSTSPDPTGPITLQKYSKDERLNFFLSEHELNDGFNRSAYLTTPTVSSTSSERLTLSDATTTDSTPETRAAARQEEKDRAEEALRRISSLTLANSKDRLRVNTQRIISTLGRHRTDATLPPKPPPATPNTHPIPKTPRAGPDTGSSEVQIALLTAKIRTLSQFLESRGHTDKMNKRNLRLLVHRRQKLMAYLRRKERGGPRWRNVVEMLGLTEGMWRGQIVLDRNMRRIEPGTLKHELYKEEKGR